MSQITNSDIKFWTKEEAEKYLNIFKANVNNHYYAYYEIFNFLEPHNESLLKLCFNLNIENHEYELRILLTKNIYYNMNAECSAYLKDVDNDEFESLDVHTTFEQCVTNEYFEELEDAIFFEISILNSEEDEDDE
jgi:hypothetical protein